MAIVVEHRRDGLLERTVSNECPPNLRQTVVGQYIWPIYQALYWFLDERVMHRNFESVEELRAVLDTWSEFAVEHGLSFVADFPLEIDASGTAIRFPEVGGWASEGIIVGLIKKVE